MAPLGFIEILDTKGGVAERIPISAFPVRIGRGYDNDVILDDPYVCPEHLAIAPNADGALVARDLNSLNGLRGERSNERLSAIELRSGSRFRIGHTHLRYCSIDHVLAATRRDREGERLQPAYVAALSAAAVFSLLCVEAYFGTVERISAVALLAEPMMTLVTVFLWAGLWSLAGRAVLGRLQFPRHLIVACAAVTGFFVLSFAAEWLEFLVPALPIIWMAGTFGAAAIMAVLVFAHLGFASAMRRRSRAWAALTISVALAAVSSVTEFASRSKFSNAMEFSAIVKPVDARLLPAISAQEFIAGSEEIKHDLDALAAQAQAEQP